MSYDGGTNVLTLDNVDIYYPTNTAIKSTIDDGVRVKLIGNNVIVTRGKYSATYFDLGATFLGPGSITIASDSAYAIQSEGPLRFNGVDASIRSGYNTAIALPGDSLVIVNSTIEASTSNKEKKAIYSIYGLRLEKTFLSSPVGSFYKDGTIENSDGTPATYVCFSAGYRGDVDGNDAFNAADVIALTNYVLDDNLEINGAKADVNADGTVNATDVIALVNKVLGN